MKRIMKLINPEAIKNQCLPRTMILLLAIITVVTTGCDDENDSNTTPDTDSETAYFIGLRTGTPSGTLYYLGAYPDVPSSVDLSEMFELGENTRIHPFGEHTFTYDRNSFVVTKFGIEPDLSLQVEGVMSIAGTGLAGFIGEPAFVSETQAYFFALQEGKVLEFNPTTMTITEVVDVPVLAFPEDPEGTINPFVPYVSGQFVLLPIRYNSNNFDVFPHYAMNAVFDSETKTLVYQKDDRMSMGSNWFTLNENREFFYGPSNQVPRLEAYGNSTGHPTTAGLLKVGPDGTFDPDFFVDLREVLNAQYVRTCPLMFGNKIVVTYYDSNWTKPADPNDWWASPVSTALVDLESGTYEPFTALDPFGGRASDIGTDSSGTTYFTALGDDNIAYLLTQNSPTEFNVLISQDLNGGSFRSVHQVR